jgi:hypothetical protein
MRGFLGVPLMVLSERLKPTRIVSVGHCLSHQEYNPRRV